MNLKHYFCGLVMMTCGTVASSAASVSADILNVLGQGGNAVELTLRWDDKVVINNVESARAMDNLVSAVRYDGTATARQIIETALTQDPRFYALRDAQGNYVAYGFDTNGDNSAAVTVGGTALTLTDGVATATGDWADAAGSSAYDHWQANTEVNLWKIFVDGKEADATATVADGASVVLEYAAAGQTAPTKAPYVFNLRPASQQGIWMQEEITLNTADGKQMFVPMIANVCGDLASLYGARVSAEIYKEDGTTTSTDYSVWISNAAQGGMSARVTVSSPGNARIRPYLNIRKVWPGSSSASVKRVYGDCDSRISTVVANPMTAIGIKEAEPGGTLELDNMGVLVITPVYNPEKPDFTGYTATFDDESVVTLYKSVNSLVAHRPGTTTMTISSLDGSVSSKYTVTVKELDTAKPAEGYLDGVIWLNEEWFGHTSGSLNYVTSEGEMYYRAYGSQNNNMAFGCTSQYAMIYAGKLFVMSKQAWDRGDTRPEKSGGRLVVADARTLKHIAAFDEIGGDGRSCVGVSPSKVYLGHANGIRVLDLETMTLAPADLTGLTVSRNGQIGNMVKVGKYVYAANIGTGLVIIDGDTDQVVGTVAASGIQGVVASLDGRAWYATANTLTPVDGLTPGTTYSIPGSITCSSGSWRSVNLYSSNKENKLYWGSGNLYCWDLGTSGEYSTDDISQVFTYNRNVDGVNYGNAYGAGGYDSRSDVYMFASMPGFGAAALDNWLHFVELSTGRHTTIKLPQYWWFPAMPVFPDKHDAVIAVDDIDLCYDSEPYVADLTKLVTDADNFDHGISVSLADGPSAQADGIDGVADVKLEGKTLTVTPKTHGRREFTLVAESNGRTVSKTVGVYVSNISTGIDEVNQGRASVYALDGSLHIDGCAGKTAAVYSADGRMVASFGIDTDAFVSDLGGYSGVFVVKVSDGATAKIVLTR